jgi:uncharacterized membrane protein YwaF
MLFYCPLRINGGNLISVDCWTNFFFTYKNPLGIQITELWQWFLYLLILMLVSALLLYLFYLPLVKSKQVKE